MKLVVNCEQTDSIRETCSGKSAYYELITIRLIGFFQEGIKGTLTKKKKRELLKRIMTEGVGPIIDSLNVL